jgi:DNA-binding MarR family transcriptional regulator
MEIAMNATSDKRVAADVRAWGTRGLDCLCGNLRMASRALSSLYDAYLAPAGITSAQLAVLWAVVSEEPLSMREIADWLVMDKTTVSRNVAALEDIGLVALKPGPDARVKLATTTAKGRKAFSRALPHWRAAQSEVEKTLGSDTFARAVAGARRLARKVQKDAGK